MKEDDVVDQGWLVQQIGALLDSFNSEDLDIRLAVRNRVVHIAAAWRPEIEGSNALTLDASSDADPRPGTVNHLRGYVG